MPSGKAEQFDRLKAPADLSFIFSRIQSEKILKHELREVGR